MNVALCLRYRECVHGALIKTANMSAPRQEDITESVSSTSRKTPSAVCLSEGVEAGQQKELYDTDKTVNMFLKKMAMKLWKK